MARRAAKSAPADVLPSLLLCCGLPRSSLLTMIDRLGHLSDGSEDSNILYTKILERWKDGNRCDMSRYLLGRLTACLRIHGAVIHMESVPISTAFISWLRKDCKLIQETKQIKIKSNKKNSMSDSDLSLTSMTLAFKSVFSELKPKLNALPVVVVATEVESFKINEHNSVNFVSLNVSAAEAKHFFFPCIQKNRTDMIDSWFQNLVSTQAPLARELKAKALLDMAIELLTLYRSLDNVRQETTWLLVKWIPVLSCSDGSPDLWELLFQDYQEPIINTGVANLLMKCATSWSERHVSHCKDWIIEQGSGNSETYNCERLALFLVSTCEQISVQTELFSEESLSPSVSGWANSREFVLSGANIAAMSLNKQGPLKRSLRRRNSLPPSLLLFFLLARRGKNQLRTVCEVLLQKLSTVDTEDTVHKCLETVFLRLYICYPHWIDLGSPAVRNVLLSASERHSSSWINWRSRYDDKIEDLLNVLVSGDVRVAAALGHFCRKQPLLILRKLPRMAALLSVDAATSETGREKRGVVSGQQVSGSLEVKFQGKDRVKLVVRHWGYSFTEPIWVALLDVLSIIPSEVLYGCGSRIGLLDFLAIYVELLSVQLQLLSADRAERLKEKLCSILVAFRLANPTGWREWLKSSRGEKEMRHMLVSCSCISAEEAIDALKVDSATKA